MENNAILSEDWIGFSDRSSVAKFRIQKLESQNSEFLNSKFQNPEFLKSKFQNPEFLNSELKEFRVTK